jgi:hypothetical protein
MAVFPHCHFLPDMAPCGFYLFLRMKSQLWGHHFQEVPFSPKGRNSETISEHPTRDSKRSVPVVLPALTEMLNPLHKLRSKPPWKGQWSTTKGSVYFVIVSVQKLLWICPRVHARLLCLYCQQFWHEIFLTFDLICRNMSTSMHKLIFINSGQLSL